MSNEKKWDISVDCEVKDGTENTPPKAEFTVHIILPDDKSKDFLISHKENLKYIFLLLLQETIIELDGRQKNPEKAGVY